MDKNNTEAGRTGRGSCIQIPEYEVIDQFLAAMRAAGMNPTEPVIADGNLHRCHLEGDKFGTKNGAYILHTDHHPAGWFKDHKRGIESNWKLEGGNYHGTKANPENIKRKREDGRKKQEQKHKETAYRARSIIKHAEYCLTHPYLTLKRVACYGLYTGLWSKRVKDDQGVWQEISILNTLLVPMYGEDDLIWNLQGIFPMGRHPVLGREKDFLRGRKQGLFFSIGKTTDTVLIAEGYATAATVHAATGYLTFVAFDCGNLELVALLVRKRFPDARIILCADNDRFIANNPGLTKAHAAAAAVGGLVSAPEFPEGVEGTDWNDLAIWRAGHA